MNTSRCTLDVIPHLITHSTSTTAFNCTSQSTRQNTQHSRTPVYTSNLQIPPQKHPLRAFRWLLTHQTRRGRRPRPRELPSPDDTASAPLPPRQSQFQKRTEPLESQ